MKTTNQPHRSVYRKSFFACKGHKRARSIIWQLKSCLLSLRTYTITKPIVLFGLVWFFLPDAVPLMLSAHTSSGFSTKSVVYIWKSLTWEMSAPNFVPNQETAAVSQKFCWCDLKSLPIPLTYLLNSSKAFGGCPLLPSTNPGQPTGF